MTVRQTIDAHVEAIRQRLYGRLDAEMRFWLRCGFEGHDLVVMVSADDEMTVVPKKLAELGK